MPIGVKLITGPTVEPVSLAEAKARLRVTVSAEDGDIASLIAECRALAEAECGRAFCTQTYSLFLDRFPCRRLVDAGAQPWRPREITIPRPPLQSVEWVKYYDEAGVFQTLDPSAYFVATAADPGRIWPVSYWPFTQYERPEAVEIRFTCGYGNATAVPLEAKAAILAILADRHVNPDGGDRGIPPAARRLLDCLETGEIR